MDYLDDIYLSCYLFIYMWNVYNVRHDDLIKGGGNVCLCISISISSSSSTGSAIVRGLACGVVWCGGMRSDDIVFYLSIFK